MTTEMTGVTAVTRVPMSTLSYGGDPGTDPPDALSYWPLESNTTMSLEIAMTLVLGTGSLEENSSVRPTDELDYIVDYDQSGNSSSLPLDLVPLTVFYVLTFLLGLVGNALVIFSILRYRRMRNVTNIFLTSLATADLLLIMLCVPIKLAKWYSFTWAFGAFLCKFVHYMQNVSVLCSVLTLTTISLERYYAILYPVKAKCLCTQKRARKVVVLVWVLSVVLAIPIIFGQVHKEVGPVRLNAYWCIKEWPSKTYSLLYEGAMLMLIFILPLAVMGFAYASICREMWRISSNRIALHAVKYDQSIPKERPKEKGGSDQNINETLNQGRLRHVAPVRDDIATRKRVIKMLVAIIVLFAICWGPLLIENVISAFGVTDALNYAHMKHVRRALHLMAYSNSFVNPIVYAFMSRNFRKCFQSTFLSLVRHASRRDPGGVTSRRSSYMVQSSSRRPSNTSTAGSTRTTLLNAESSYQVAKDNTLMPPKASYFSLPKSNSSPEHSSVGAN